MQNTKEALISYLESQIKKTKLEIKDCDRFNHPTNIFYKENLQSRLEWLEFQHRVLNKK